MNLAGPSSRLDRSEFAAALALWIGNVLWAWYPEATWLLIAGLLPGGMWCLWAFLKMPERLISANAWFLPLSLNQTGHPWADYSGLLPSGLILLVWVKTRIWNQSSTKAFDWTFGIILSWLCWLGISASMALMPMMSWTFVIQWMIPVLALIAFRAQVVFQLKAVAIRYGFSMCAILIYAVLISPYSPKLSGMPFFGGDNAMAGALLPAVFLLPMSKQSRWVAVLAAVAASVWVFWISRGAMLGLLAGGLTWVALWTGKRHFRWGLTIFGIAALGFLLWPRQKQAVGDEHAVFSLANQFSNEERMMRWELALRMAADYPVSGVGPGCFSPEFKHYLKTDSEVAKISYWHGWTGGAHQVWLGAIAETGWVGAILLLGWFAVASWWGMQVWQKSDIQKRFLLAAWIALWVHLQVEDLLIVDACFWIVAWLGITFMEGMRPLENSQES